MPLLASSEEKSVHLLCCLWCQVQIIIRLWCRKFLHLFDHHKLIEKTISQEGNQTEMMMNSTTRNIEIYEAVIKNLSRSFAMDVELSKIERKTLLTLEILHYLSLIEKYQHLKGIVMEDKHQKLELPIHILPSVGEHSKIKTSAMTRVGKKVN